MKIKRRNDLSVRLLEIFGMLMLHQTTVAAAAELGISQPSVSAAIKQLEDQLGFPLFERQKKRMQPTSEARLLFEEIEPLFEQLRSIESRVRDLRGGSAGKLRLLATPPLGHSVVPVALRTFLDGRPAVTVQYDVRRLEDVIDAVSIGACDLGLCLGLESHPGVTVRTPRTDLMRALVQTKHHLAGSEAIGPAETAQAGFIGLDRVSRLGSQLQASFDAAGVDYAPQVEVRYCHTAAILAQAGNGVAVVDAYTAMTIGTMDLVTLPFRPKIAVPASLITRSDHPMSLLASEFATIVERTMAEMSDALDAG